MNGPYVRILADLDVISQPHQHLQDRLDPDGCSPDSINGQNLPTASNRTTTFTMFARQQNPLGTFSCWPTCYKYRTDTLALVHGLADIQVCTCKLEQPQLSSVATAVFPLRVGRITARTLRRSVNKDVGEVRSFCV